jgi:hypothetical protein
MPETAPPQPSSNPATFASLLASLTGAARQPADRWDDGALADDVATISYEQALRSHRRVRTSEPLAAPPAIQNQYSPAKIPAPPSNSESATKSCKTASITIRITHSEQVQLKERAAAAQLSVSAYLRSCIFEAESLRAQVKKALSQMRAAAPQPPQGSQDAKPTQAFPGRFRFFQHWTHKREASV